MSSLIFDTGPIISLTTNNLLWILDELKKKYKGDFIITSSVHHELIDRPLESKKFKFEALQVMKSVDDGILTVLDDAELRNTTIELLDLANRSFMTNNNYLRIVQFAEMSSIAAALHVNADAFVVDERTSRLLIENPKVLEKIFAQHLHTDVQVEMKNLMAFKNKIKSIKVIRSVELVTVAFEKGLLDRYLPPIPNKKRVLLESVLWGVKLNGCAVSEKEIDGILSMVT